MKRLFTTAVSTLALMGIIAPAATAQEYRTSPFELVYLGYQGYLEDAGIPAYGRFENMVNLNFLDAEELIEAGISANRIPASVRDDYSYEQAVRIQLRRIVDERGFGD